MRRVLVTRPQPAADRTAARLKALGFMPVVLPLSETRALTVDAGGIPARPGAVAASSANAIRHAPTAFIAALAAAPCFCVGERTADAARQAGFREVTEASGDAEGLARIVIADAASPVVYLCGRLRRPLFEARLTAAGMAVIAVETYDTVRIAPGDEEILSALGEKPVDAALLYSVEAAAALLELADRRHAAHFVADAALLCLSPRIADVLRGQAAGKILVAAEPTEEALLSLLGRPD